MRLPRVRFTVGTLLFSVAIVAGNCWTFRRSCETGVYEGGRISYRLLPADIGVMPLFTVAIVGVWLMATRRLRTLRHGRAVNRRSPLAGVTYFSLHFLLLGGLVSVLMPDAVRSVQGIADEVTRYPGERWGAILSEPGGTVPWIVFDSLLLGALISGPPLLLSWIGQVLATRCAATLPRRRFRAMSWLVSLGFLSADLAVCLMPQPFRDEQELVLDFQVIDEASGHPVRAAFVWITDPFPHDPDAVPARALTDEGGRARLAGRFVVEGQRTAFQTLGGFSPWGRWLEVSAAGHRTRRIPLTEALGLFVDPVRPVHGKVSLSRGETQTDGFRDLAGFYTNGPGGFGGCWLKIEPDGRFAWCAWGCTSEHREYGFLKRHDGEFELAPVPHPGEELAPAMTLKYRAIEWGNRLYLSTTAQHDLREFCWEVLTAFRRPNDEYVDGSYLRESVCDKPRKGLPRLPMEVWVRFLNDETSVSDKESTVRRALDSLFRRVAGKGRARTEGRQG
jgi:hypothetical protein